MDAKLAGINIVLTFGLAIAFSYGQRAEIMANWPKRRCEPGVVASAFLYKPYNDPKTPAEFASENYQFCQGKIAQQVIDTAAYPVKQIQEQQKNIVGGIIGGINAAGSLGNKLASFFNDLMESVKRRFMGTYVEIQKSFGHLFNIMGKIMASITAVAMALIGVLVSLTTLIQFSLYVLSVIIGILIALMVIFAAFISPVSWLVFAGISVVGILAGIIVGVITQSAFCIAGDTTVLLAGGSTKPLSKIKVGDILVDGGQVTATMEFLVPPTKHEPLVSINGVVMSPTHMLEVPGSRITAAKDHPDAVSAGTLRRLYNLNTTSRRIPVMGDTGRMNLLDYEEIPEDCAILDKWNKHVFETLNPGKTLTYENPDNVEAGIEGMLEVRMKDGRHMPICAIVCGDEIERPGGFTTVCGKVEIVLEDETLYNGLSAGVWMFDTAGWKSAQSVGWLPEKMYGKQKLYHLFTESGDFIVGNWIVRDFSEVGLDRLSETYGLVEKNIGVKIDEA